MKEWITNTNFDFKKIPYLEKNLYSEISELFENVLKKQTSFLFDNLTMAEVLSYREPSDEMSIENIRNWLRYRIINLLLGCTIFDCESSKEAKEIYTLLGWDKERNFDNIHSFQTIWTTVVKKFGKKKTSEYYQEDKNKYEVFAHTLLRNANTSLNHINPLAIKLWQLNNIENFQIPENILNELSKLAKNTHTIGNFMPCPGNHYNFAKGNFDNCCDDRIDLILHKMNESPNSIFYQDFYSNQEKCLTKEEVEMIFGWFSKDKIDHYLLNCYLEYQKEFIIKSMNSFKRITQFTEKEEIYTYLNQINSLIETRCNRISQKLGL